jgi:beta-xylosidase
MEMHYTLSNLFIFETFPGQGLSVRLIKDNSVDTGYMTGNNGKIYHTVKIGNQVWMANNLAETFYRDGTPISYVVSNADWVIAGNNALPSMCAYEHTLSNV